MRCTTAPRDSIPLGPRKLLLISSKKRCLRNAASVAEAFTLKPIARRVGTSFAHMYESGVGLTGTHFLCKYDKVGLSVVTHRPF